MTQLASSGAASVHPAAQIEAAVERTLGLATTWLAWDGRPRLADGSGRVYTPHKVIRRFTDHLIDHLAQIEAMAAGISPMPNDWLESRVTTQADLAVFTETDLNEATQRLQRLSQVYRLRIEALGETEWDRSRGQEWTIRQVVEHVASSWYAEQLGTLS